MDEFDPAADLGFEHDRQLVCSCQGFLQYNNSSRDLCKRFADNGDRLYDLISRYDDILAYVLNRSDGRSGNTVRFIAPFLKAFGITDHAAMEYCSRNLKIMPEAGKVMRHMQDTLPVFVSTSSYEHNVLSICSELGIPRTLVDCTDVSFDGHEMTRQDARAIREMANRITGLRMPRQEYVSGIPVRLQRDEAEMVTVLDKIFNEKLKDLPASGMMRQFRSVGANEKAYFLIDLRKRTNVDFDGTAFIGGDVTDVHALEMIRERSGLAVSFNGCDLAVRKSNIAVMSRDCTVAAVLAQEFYSKGIGAVFDLVENWDREALKRKDFSDPHLMSSMLASNPKTLPEVHIIGRDNMDEIAKKSDKYRRELFRR